MTEQIAFVAGATGYTGREVVRLALERGLRTIAHVRPDSSQLASWRERFDKLGAEVDTTAWTQEAMTARFAELQPGIVFALLGTTRARGGDYDKVDYGLTAMLVHAAAAMEHKPRLVYLSSLGIGASEPSPKSYMHARWACEKLLHEADVPYTIARPSFITGDDRDDSRPGERIGSAVANGALALAGLLGGRKVRERYRSTSNTALAQSLVRLALDPSAANATIESEDLR
jgi:uncharacterized protein YbjT (DUF2867 family)